jgi:Uma2 family endonuclease
VITECFIQTSDGVKVADVVWLPEGFVSEFGFVTPYPKAPEICIEIVSPSNSKIEI